MTPQKNLPLLLNLTYVGFNRGLKGGDFAPILNPDGTTKETFCNRFVQYVCNGLGYDVFTGMNANDMVQFMMDPTSGWLSPADESVAQSHANQGVIVLAGWSNPDGHGHVNIILPGVLEKSGEWGISVPKCANVGKDVFYGKKVSFAFSAHQMPRYFALVGMV